MPNYRRPQRRRRNTDREFSRPPSNDDSNQTHAAGNQPDADDLDALDADDFRLDRLELDRLDAELLAQLRGAQLGDIDLARLSADLGEEFEIIDFEHDDSGDDWDAEWDHEADDLGRARAEWRAAHPQIPVDDLLRELAQAESLPPITHLYSFSDLSRADADKVRRSWGLIAPERRLALVNSLVTSAEEDVSLELGPFLRIAMLDQDAAVRSTAVRGLWEDGQADLVGPLVQMLQNDPDVETRAAAATALGSYVLAGELEELDAALAMRAEEALLAVLHDEMEPCAVRRRALESIAYSGEAGVRQLIEDGYYDANEEMRISALFAMGRSADVRWRALVRAELQNPSPLVRREAALACGELEAQSALEDLLALLQDEVGDVRLAAIFALGRIGGRDARDALDTVLLGGDPDEVEAAEQALEEMQFYADHLAIPLFDESLEDDDEWDGDPVDGWSGWDERDLGQYE
jgi:HEAT repeat protein